MTELNELCCSFKCGANKSDPDPWKSWTLIFDCDNDCVVVVVDGNGDDRLIEYQNFIEFE